jgi:hypothetical protein
MTRCFLSPTCISAAPNVEMFRPKRSPSCATATGIPLPDSMSSPATANSMNTRRDESSGSRHVRYGRRADANKIHSLLGDHYMADSQL